MGRLVAVLTPECRMTITLLSAVPADSMRLAREMAEIRSVSGVVAAAPWTASTSW